MEKMLMEMMRRLEVLEAENKELKVKVAKLEMDNEELWERLEDLEDIEVEEE